MCRFYAADGRRRKIVINSRSRSRVTATIGDGIEHKCWHDGGLDSCFVFSFFLQIMDDVAWLQYTLGTLMGSVVNATYDDRMNGITRISLTHRERRDQQRLMSSRGRKNVVIVTMNDCLQWKFIFHSLQFVLTNHWLSRLNVSRVKLNLNFKDILTHSLPSNSDTSSQLTNE